MPPFHYEVGQEVMILHGTERGRTWRIEEREMSSGVVSIPLYSIRGHRYSEKEIASPEELTPEERAELMSPTGRHFDKDTGFGS